MNEIVKENIDWVLIEIFFFLDGFVDSDCLNEMLEYIVFNVLFDDKSKDKIERVYEGDEESIIVESEVIWI